MAEFFSAATSFITGCAEFFEIQIPFIHITFFQLFASVLLVKVVIAAIKVIFGLDHSGDEA